MGRKAVTVYSTRRSNTEEPENRFTRKFAEAVTRRYRRRGPAKKLDHEFLGMIAGIMMTRDGDSDHAASH
jgi:hypothetical protein